MTSIALLNYINKFVYFVFYISLGVTVIVVLEFHLHSHKGLCQMIPQDRTRIKRMNAQCLQIIKLLITREKSQGRTRNQTRPLDKIGQTVFYFRLLYYILCGVSRAKQLKW